MFRAAALVTPVLQGQQRKIAELESQLAALVARLEESERARQAAEARVAELGAEVRHKRVQGVTLFSLELCSENFPPCPVRLRGSA